MTQGRRKELEEVLDRLETRLTAEKDPLKQIPIRRALRILDAWEHFEAVCKREGFVVVW